MISKRDIINQAASLKPTPGSQLGQSDAPEVGVIFGRKLGGKPLPMLLLFW